MKPREAPLPDSRHAQDVASFCRDAVPQAQQRRESFPSNELWAAVAATGTSLWLDTGDLDAAAGLWTREFRALTTNNTLLNKEVQKGIYDDLVPDAAALLQGGDRPLDGEQLVQEIAFVLNAVHALKLVRAFDADVSVELHTAFADDAEASWRYGTRYHAVCPERFIVKVPLTPAGLLAARRLSDDGIRVNFTLGFSARQNYLIALLARPTWCNVFMGRINSFLADNKLGNGENAGEKATLSSQRMLRRLLESTGIRVQQIGASMRSGKQCLDLLGLDVFTMPVAAAKEFLQLAPSGDAVRDRTGDDPAVAFAPGVDGAARHLDVFWQIDAEFERAMCTLAGMDHAGMTPADVVAFLADHGVGDLFPTLDPAAAGRVAKEGKIPVHASWERQVAQRTASWDGMLTAAALASFTQDQQALDARIQRLV